jgi:hypothetical protein
LHDSLRVPDYNGDATAYGVGYQAHLLALAKAKRSH